jgi:TonB family protein
MDNAPQPPAPPPEKRKMPLAVLIAIVALGIPLLLAIILSVIAIAGGVVAYFLAAEGVEEHGTQVQAVPAIDEYATPEPPPVAMPPEEPEEQAPLAVAPPKKKADKHGATGKLEAKAIKAVMNKNASGFKYCYERSLAKDPALQGKVTIAFTIGTKGNVTQADVKATTLDNAEVEKCLVNRLKKLRFPKPRGGAVKVSYPLIFKPSG